ncbi:hypothetical protein ACVR05_05225 [Streptococcus caprae]|uniref:Cell wall-active antibiotics response LiaF-like C-terminal domain-containing protein n=1 Tax=Streptococcus caprae TaxID=1640501 RepID=A0ABV8CTA7_9STRE
MKKTLIGLGLIALAGYLLFGGSFNLPHLGISLWLLIFVVGFGLATLQNLLRKDWTSSYVCGVITFILLNHHFDWLKVSTGVFIFAAVLAGVGLQILFRPLNSTITIKGKGIHEYIGSEKKSSAKKASGADTVFGSNTRYVNGDVTEVGGDVVFGSSILYFDNAHLPLGHATFSGDAVFSSVKLYVPRDWTVEFTGDRVFSSVKLDPSYTAATNKLYVTGDLVFSSLVVEYI